MRVLLYYAHPGQQHSKVNQRLYDVAQTIRDITFVDLYRDYPRHDIDVMREQQRLQEHDVILFQFPVFWYSSPSIVKEWQDLVLEYDYAYGPQGDKLHHKYFGLLLTTGGSEESYQYEGFQKRPLTAFLTPFERTAELCGMAYLPPLVHFSALSQEDPKALKSHISAYRGYIEALRDDEIDMKKLMRRDILDAKKLGRLGVV